VRAGRQADRQASIQTDRQTLRQSDRRNRWAEASGKNVIVENPGPPSFVLHTSLLTDLQSFHAFFQSSLVVVPLDASFVRQWLQQRVLMIYRGSGFLGVVWFGSSPPLPAVSKRDTLVTEEGIRGWGRSQITHWRESLALYETFNALWAPEAERLTHKYQQKQREGWSLDLFLFIFLKG